jgi:DNA topoisomerase-1
VKLIIVESPTKTKSLAKYLGSDYEVLATMGHIRDLPKSKMGVEIKTQELKNSRTQDKRYEFVPEYVENPDKRDTISKLEAAAKKAEVVLLASDPDREGEAIAWHAGEILKQGKILSSKIKRVTFHSITKEAILEAIKNPREIDMSMVEAQQARRVLDRIVGYQLSPILWRKVRRGLSAGRVQSVATRMIADREKEIEAFKAEEYWQISCQLSAVSRQLFWVELMKIGGKNVEINNGEEANSIKSDLDKGEYLVDRVEKKERKVYPHPPFKTSTLQQAAANVLGWSAKKAMQVAQSLYEKGAITYHRTDSLNLVDSEVEKIRTYISNKFGVEALPEKTIVYKTGGKVVAQEAHEAIR